MNVDRKFNAACFLNFQARAFAVAGGLPFVFYSANPLLAALARDAKDGSSSQSLNAALALPAIAVPALLSFVQALVAGSNVMLRQLLEVGPGLLRTAVLALCKPRDRSLRQRHTLSSLYLMPLCIIYFSFTRIRAQARAGSHVAGR
jgi:hypothetical protein